MLYKNILRPVMASGLAIKQFYVVIATMKTMKVSLDNEKAL